jgi:hypothetical protein
MSTSPSASQPISAPALTLYPDQVAAVASYLLANPTVAHAYGLAPAVPVESLPDKPEIRTCQLGAEATLGRGYHPIIVFEQARGAQAAEIENRTYHMGKKPTLGKDYDDRLTTRLGCSPTTAYLYLGLAEHRGGIRHRRFGKKYHITERAVRAWEGDIKLVT